MGWETKRLESPQLSLGSFHQGSVFGLTIADSPLPGKHKAKNCAADSEQSIISPHCRNKSNCPGRKEWGGG